MKITYRQLLSNLQLLEEEQLDMGVMIYDTEQDDFYPVWKLDKAYKDDEIDEGHPLLLI